MLLIHNDTPEVTNGDVPTYCIACESIRRGAYIAN